MILKISCIASGFLISLASLQAETPLRLWHDKPASIWTEALAIRKDRQASYSINDRRQMLLQVEWHHQAAATSSQRLTNPHPVNSLKLPLVLLCIAGRAHADQTNAKPVGPKP